MEAAYPICYSMGPNMEFAMYFALKRWTFNTSSCFVHKHYDREMSN